MLVIIFGLWNGWRGKTYQAHHVNAAARMVRSNLTLPHVIVCATDTPAGLDMNMLDCVVPLWPMWPGLQTWTGRPNCFHRLHMYSPAWQTFLHHAAVGDKWPQDETRIVSMDIDMVVTGNLDHLFSGMERYKITAGRACRYNGSLQMLQPGMHTRVFDDFDPITSPLAIMGGRTERGTRLIGSDQAWLHLQVPDAATWTQRDGVYFYQKDQDLARVPRHGPECLWFFAGSTKPWHQAMRVRGKRLFDTWTEHAC